MNDQQPNWQPLSMLSSFSKMIDGMLEVSEEQLESLAPVLNKPHILDDETLDRIFSLYRDQLNDLPLFTEQFSRWKKEELTKDQEKEIDRLIDELAKLKVNGVKILEMARSIEPGTIDKIMEMDELELALGVLSGEIKPPR